MIAMCLPCKEIEDQQMGIAAARFYGRTIAHIEGIKASSLEGAFFYADALEGQREVAKYLIYNKKLTNEQIDRLIKQTQESCYRADKLKAWALKPENDIREKADAWRDEILSWQADDQKFFTDLFTEVGGWYEFAAEAAVEAAQPAKPRTRRR